MVSNERSYRRRKTFPAIISQKIFAEKKEITYVKSIARNFIKHFTEIRPTPAKRTESSPVTFDKYLKAYNITQPEKCLTDNKISLNL